MSYNLFLAKSWIKKKQTDLAKNSYFAISKKQIIWHKTIELFMVNCQIWYDLEDWFKCFKNFRTGSLAMRHNVYLTIT